jgi:thymidylate kinase
VHAANLIEFESQRFSPQEVKTRVARALISALERECKTYSLLSGYEQLPDDFETEIKFMVNHEDFEKMSSIIAQVARQTSTQLFHSVDRETTERSYSLASQCGSEITIVQVVCLSDYCDSGLLMLRAEEVLAARRWHPRGFWIPACAHQFAISLRQRLKKAEFGRQDGDELSRLYAEDCRVCDQMIARFWQKPECVLLSRMAASNDWTAIRDSIEVLRCGLKQTASEPFAEKMTKGLEREYRRYRRLSSQGGGWIALIGPGGAGKSAVIDAIRKQFSKAYEEINCIEAEAPIPAQGTNCSSEAEDKHNQPHRGMLASIGQLIRLTTGFLLAYAIQIVPATRHSKLVISDRYVYDLLIGSRRFRYRGPQWLLHLATRLIPRPDLVILLDAPARVLHLRRSEFPLDEAIEQRASYLQLLRSMHDSVVINASKPLPDVIHDVESVIVDYFSRRTSNRLNTQVRTPVVTRIDAEAPEHQW